MTSTSRLPFRSPHDRSGIWRVVRRESESLQKAIGIDRADDPLRPVTEIGGLAADAGQGELVELGVVSRLPPSSALGQLHEEKGHRLGALNHSCGGGCRL